ncbi:NAD(P)/FAD-dependent oxidoreductase [bacterium]|nr:NAD(P)/FAD-dependent oxidoreductase [bacterium]
MMRYDIIIVGAGPAGLFAAISAPKNRRILLLEKQEKPARKLLISGNGQANLTHSGSVSDFLSRYGKAGKKYIKYSLFNFSNQNLLNFFGERGVKFICTEKGKHFPASLKANDLLSTLLDEVRLKNIDLQLDSAVISVTKKENVFEIQTEQKRYKAEKVLITTGGKSYPTTGSSGDGQNFAKELGHSIVPMTPALTAVSIRNHQLTTLSGISFPTLSLTIRRENKKIATFHGEMLITHKGLSGPLILDNSRMMQQGDTLSLNFCGINKERFITSLLNDASHAPKMTLKHHLKQYNILRRLEETIVSLTGIELQQNIAELGKKRAQRLAELFTEFPCIVNNLAGFDSAMVTAGGVTTSEINPKTMESKIVENLFFAGEVIDIDGDSGGFNLQWAFSSGFVAGKNL